MTKVKRLATALLACAMMVSTIAMSASAAEVQPRNNHHDESFDFSFWFAGKDNTTGYPKEDDSSTYVQCTTCPTSGFAVFVDGGNSSSGSWDDGTTIGSPRISRTGKFLVRQWVYESGYRYARLGGYRNSGSGNAVGKWSPDYDSDYDSAPYAVTIN